MEINNEYIIYKLIRTNFGDPISSILLTSDHVIIGTMLGQISYLALISKQISILSEINTENISNISFNSDDEIINITIGDEKIFRYKKVQINPEKLYLFQKVSIYANEMEHNNFCQNCYTSLSPHLLFRIQLSPPEEKCLNIIDIENEYDIINIVNKEVIYIGRLPMTNYIVPFGFDGENFAWVEFIGPDERNICIANVINNVNNKGDNLVHTFKKNIGKNFGHISHLKILTDSKIFLVHSLNICEIRQLNNEFTLLESFKHIGDEVYAVDIYYPNDFLKLKNSQKSSSDIFLYSNNLLKIEKIKNINGKNIIKTSNNDNNSHINNKEENNKNKEKMNLEKPKTMDYSNKKKQLLELEGIDKEMDIIKNKIIKNTSDNSECSNKKEININIQQNNKNSSNNDYSNIDISFSIITLDIDGNVNLYQNGEEVTLFNLYDFKDISQKMKNDKFFSMGYEYYIKSNMEYFCISTDQGCFVVKKSL